MSVWDLQRVQAGRENLFHHAVQGVQQSHADQPDPEDLTAHLDPGTGQKWYYPLMDPKNNLLTNSLMSSYSNAGIGELLLRSKLKHV